MRVVLIPPVGRVELIDVPGGKDLFPALYKILDCTTIEALPILGRDKATMYADEEAGFVNRQVCPRCEADWVPDERRLRTLPVRCQLCHAEVKRPAWVEGRHPNELASKLVYGPAMSARERLRDDMAVAGEHVDFVIDATGGARPRVLGPVVVCGFNPGSGRSLNCPTDLANELLAESGQDQNSEAPAERVWSTTGAEYTGPEDRERVEREIAGLRWRKAEADMSLPMSPGLAIKEVIKQMQLPRVSRIAYNGMLEWPDGSETATYAVYGIEANYTKGLVARVRLYVLDTGVACIPLCHDVWQREEAVAA
jgi:hypothetical protein